MWIWVRIHKSCVKNDKDSDILYAIQNECSAKFNTHTSRSMWFDFESLENAQKFVRLLNKKLPYLKWTLGN